MYVRWDYNTLNYQQFMLEILPLFEKAKVEHAYT